MVFDGADSESAVEIWNLDGLGSQPNFRDSDREMGREFRDLDRGFGIRDPEIGGSPLSPGVHLASYQNRRGGTWTGGDPPSPGDSYQP